VLHFALSGGPGSHGGRETGWRLSDKRPRRTYVRLTTLAPCERAGVVIRRSRSRTSPGGARHGGNATTTAGFAVLPTSRSTTGPIASDISSRLRSERRPLPPSVLPISSRIYASIPAPIAARPIRSFSSSTISGTRNSISLRASEIATGSACSTRLQSARSFVQTVIDAAPLIGVASLVRW